MDGYLYKFKVYQGNCENKNIQNIPKFIGLGDRIICQMIASLHNKYHEVSVDNFFTFVPLMEYLLSNKVLCCGAIPTRLNFLLVSRCSLLFARCSLLAARCSLFFRPNYCEIKLL